MSSNNNGVEGVTRTLLLFFPATKSPFFFIHGHKRVEEERFFVVVVKASSSCCISIFVETLTYRLLCYKIKKIKISKIEEDVLLGRDDKSHYTNRTSLHGSPYHVS